MTLGALADRVRAGSDFAHKLDIRAASAMLGGVGAVAAARGAGREAVRLGDDCAALPDGTGGHLLFAIEALRDEFVAADPWFAGYCGVMVNVSDVASMGGRPVAVVDALTGTSGARAERVWEGMRAAAERYGVPIVGGHTNVRAQSDHLAVAILGRATRLLTSFDARPGDVILSATDLRGSYRGSNPFWNASTRADPARLRADLEILPKLAEDGLCRAAKDVSMGGLVGTLLMLLECSGVGAVIDPGAAPRPPRVPLELWLTSFPSFGYLLAVAPEHAAAVAARFHAANIACAPIGACDASCRLELRDGAEREVVWDLRERPMMGFGPAAMADRG